MCKEKETCEHKNWRVRPTDLIGSGYCPDCDKTFYLYELVNSTAIRLRNLIEEAESKIKVEAEV